MSRSGFLKSLFAGALCLQMGALVGCKTGSDSASTDTASPASGGKSSAGGGTSTASSAGKAEQKIGDEIVVGEYASLTGDTATFGTDSDAGLQYAVKKINDAGGIDVAGKKMKVRVLKEDDQSKPEEAKTVAVKFASDPSIVAVIGEVASTRSLNAAPEFQRAGIPMISPSSTAEKVTQIGDYIFRVCFIDPFQGVVMAKFAYNDLKAKKVGIMRSVKSDYSVGLADVFKKEFEKLGGTIVADVSYSDTDSDFRSQLGKLKDVDAIFVPGYYGEVGTIARQKKELGINAPLLGGDGWDSPKLIEGAGGPGGALEGSYFSTHYSPDAKDPRVQEFVKEYAAANDGKKPASLVAQGYDAMMVLADAIKRAGSVERSKVRDALAQTKDYPAVTGKLTLDANRNATKSAVVLQIKGNDFVYTKTVEPSAS